MADIKENQMSQGTAVYLRGVDASGNSILVPIQQVIAPCYRYIERIDSETDLNNLLTMGVYMMYPELGIPKNSPPVSGENARGMVSVDNANGHIFQYYQSLNGLIYSRGSYAGVNWSVWRQI